MTKQAQILAVVANTPATFPQIRKITGLTTHELSWELARMLKEGLVHRTGVRRKYVYRGGPAPVEATLDNFFQGINRDLRHQRPMAGG